MPQNVSPGFRAFAGQGLLPCYVRYVDERALFLMRAMVEQFCAQRKVDRVSYINFGVGDFPCKTWLCDDQSEQARVRIFARSRKGIYRNALDTRAAAFDEASRRRATRLGLLSGIRKFPRAVRHFRSTADHTESQM